MRDYPASIVATDHIEPAPRRIRGMLGNAVVFDTTRAVYVWEHPHFPQYYIPYADIDRRFIIDEDEPQHLRRGTARRHGLRAGDIDRPGSAWLFGQDALEGLDGFVRFDWPALDAWYEEDEEVFVHPRSPYSRVDALRSNRLVHLELDGVVLAESSSPIMVFETGLPTRYYLDRTTVNFNHLRATTTETACPYKGRTTGYWTAEVKGQTYPDIAWTYDFPTRQLLPIAGLIAFYNEKVDIYLDGVLLERPHTPFS
ncbi:MAG TPA: DUF427 domain-containing protein [Micromonosporaceae bacterium]|jgi:uncharacterized protein (DUF427 family)|nr:DUF427 domain-containing protein [Micromonosporaceae bacterium]